MGIKQLSTSKEKSPSSKKKSPPKSTLTVCHAIKQHIWLRLIVVGIITVFSIYLGFQTTKPVIGVVGGALDIVAFYIGLNAVRCSTSIDSR
jgi:hypothetical protein